MQERRAASDAQASPMGAALWNVYYNRTRDYSCGPAVTLYLDPKDNARNDAKTREVFGNYLKKFVISGKCSCEDERNV